MTAIWTSERDLIFQAPASGVLRFVPPRALTGELEVFDANHLVARVDGDQSGEVRAPAHGFVLRRHAEDGTVVAKGTPILEFRIA